MNRNTELHFGSIPEIKQQRSKFDLSHSIKTTFNNGQLIPLDVQEVLPGDTIQIDMSNIVRMATPIYPVMDNMYCDIYWFFVPRRLTWEHWEEFWGQNDDEWTQQIEYEIPQMKAPYTGWESGTIADYMGIPTHIADISVDACYFRAYAKIYSDWFRSENLQKSAHMYTDDTERRGNNGTNYVTDLERGGYPAQIDKLMDYFTGALPAPQKGPAVAIPLGTTAPVSGTIANVLNASMSGSGSLAEQTGYVMTGSDRDTNIGTNPLTLRGFTTGNPVSWPPVIKKDSGNMYATLMNDNDSTFNFNFAGSPPSWQTGEMQYEGNLTGLRPSNLLAKIPEQQIGVSGSVTGSVTSTPSLYADLTDATAATINELRTAFAIQKYYEGAARYGTRYIEYLRGVFGVVSSDARLQRSEYLGGMRFMINMDQVLQTSATDAVSPQGNTAGFSCTNVKDSLFTKSFEEHGILMCLIATRTEHSYQQGINKMFSRKKWTDFYNPYFANLGEMPILNKEIYAQGTTVVDTDGNIIDDQVFGYQEAWAEYRYIPNRVSGNMRSNASDGSLDAWTYVDNYASLPMLGDTWIRENTDNVDNTIAVSSQLANQIWGDFYIREYATRVMPVYSLPGLIDHV